METALRPLCDSIKRKGRIFLCIWSFFALKQPRHKGVFDIPVKVVLFCAVLGGGKGRHHDTLFSVRLSSLRHPSGWKQSFAGKARWMIHRSPHPLRGFAMTFFYFSPSVVITSAAKWSFADKAGWTIQRLLLPCRASQLLDQNVLG